MKLLINVHILHILEIYALNVVAIIAVMTIAAITSKTAYTQNKTMMIKTYSSIIQLVTIMQAECLVDIQNIINSSDTTLLI